MNRRNFAKTLAGGALSTAALNLAPLAAAPAGQNVEETPFKTSIMLWTILHQLPFEERLEKVAEAGYHAVELVGEYAKWTDDDFLRYNKKRLELGIKFDCTAGTRHGAGDPSVRDAFLADIREQMEIMKKIDCPALIVMSGNVVPGLSPQQQHDSCVEGLSGRRSWWKARASPCCWKTSTLRRIPTTTCGPCPTPSRSSKKSIIPR